MNNKWSPICGHYFWNNNFGATAFCKELGYPSGSWEHTNNELDEDSIQVGQCSDGEELMACTAGYNEYSITNDCKRDSENGKKAGIRITCENQADRYTSCGVESKSLPRS